MGIAETPSLHVKIYYTRVTCYVMAEGLGKGLVCTFKFQ